MFILKKENENDTRNPLHYNEITSNLEVGENRKVK